MEEAVLLDNTDPQTKKKNIIKLNTDKNKGFTLKCPSKYYKGALVVDPNHTYHFFIDKIIMLDLVINKEHYLLKKILVKNLFTRLIRP